jgi:L-ribulose-5-phosphate 4-epimerase
MLEELRARVCAVNQMLSTAGLAPQTWGNASGIDRMAGIVAIKPSGVPYAALTPDDVVLVDLNGHPAFGNLAPSVDLPTHLELYRAFPDIGGVVHTHSHYAVCWAQARRPIPCLGTTHADYFHGEIPLTRQLTEAEMGDYEVNTGRVIAEAFSDRPALHCPGVLVAGHAPFTWGVSVEKALEAAIVMEEVARMAFHTRALAPDATGLEAHILAKHHERKHGDHAYYGQRQ